MGRPVQTLNTAQLASVIANELRKYEGAVIDEVNEAAKATGKSVRNDITEQASSFWPNSEYAQSWRVTKKKVRNRNDETYIVHSLKYRIAHLLEKGHAKVNGGRVEGKPHIKPAEERGIELFRSEIKKRIEAIK